MDLMSCCSYGTASINAQFELSKNSIREALSGYEDNVFPEIVEKMDNARNRCIEFLRGDTFSVRFDNYVHPL